MKKVIFSAVAMIAFVGSSMANTSEVKNVKNIEKVTFSGCGDVYHATYITAKQNGANDDQAGIVAWKAYTTCLNVLTPAPLNP